jgi:uncharacterized heparinase superfamily protein
VIQIRYPESRIKIFNKKLVVPGGGGALQSSLIVEILLNCLPLLPVYSLYGVAAPERFCPVSDRFFICLSFFISLMIPKIALLV